MKKWCCILFIFFTSNATICHFVNAQEVFPSAYPISSKEYFEAITQKMAKTLYCKNLNPEVIILRRRDILGQAYQGGAVVLTTGLIQLLESEDEMAAFMATSLSLTDTCTGASQKEKNKQIGSIKKTFWDGPADAINEFVGTFQLLGSVLTLNDIGMQKAENQLRNLSYNKKLSPKAEVDKVFESKYYSDFHNCTPA